MMCSYKNYLSKCSWMHQLFKLVGETSDLYLWLHWATIFFIVIRETESLRFLCHIRMRDLQPECWVSGADNSYSGNCNDSSLKNFRRKFECTYALCTNIIWLNFKMKVGIINNNFRILFLLRVHCRPTHDWHAVALGKFWKTDIA